MGAVSGLHVCRGSCENLIYYILDHGECVLGGWTKYVRLLPADKVCNQRQTRRYSDPRPSSYPLLGPKYPLLEIIYPQLRVQRRV